MAMGRHPPSRILSVTCARQFRFLILVWLLIFLNTSDCSSTPTSDETETFRLSENGWEYEQKDASKCPSAAGAKQLEQGVELSLHHIYGTCSPLRPANSSWTTVLLEMLKRDPYRVQDIRSRISSRLAASANVPLQPGPIYGTVSFVARLGIGRPAQTFILTLDTGSDITWMQCKPCTTCYHQADPIFNPKQSSSYKVLKCSSSECNQLPAAVARPKCFFDRRCRYGIGYADGSKSFGYLSQETLTLGSDWFPKFTFGCGHENEGTFIGAAGLVGLGRNPLALPSQTAGKYQGYFSYCFPEYGNPSAVGSLSFGPSAIPSSNVVFTTLLRNPGSPSYYYVSLSGISLGSERLDIPQQAFEHTDDGKGTIIDSGTFLSRLAPLAYEPLREAFKRNASGLLKAPAEYLLDTCYYLPRNRQVNIPTVTLHFADSAAVEMSSVGTLYMIYPSRLQACLAFTPTYDGLNVIGSFLQQRVRVAYDTVGERVGFAHQSCTSSSP